MALGKVDVGTYVCVIQLGRPIWLNLTKAWSVCVQATMYTVCIPFLFWNRLKSFNGYILTNEKRISAGFPYFAVLYMQSVLIIKGFICKVS